MRHLRLHFLAGYAMLGAIGPFFPEFLRSGRGFDAAQIGGIFAASQACIMVAPAMLTYLADRMVSPRLLAVLIFALAIASLGGLWFSTGFFLNLFLYAVFGFAFAAMIPSMDGLYFAVQRKHALESRSTPPYHRIRVLGTFGFIIPSAVLLVLVPEGGNLIVIIPVAACFAIAALANSCRLPDPRTSEVEPAAIPRMPTMEAARALFSGRTVAFCFAMSALQVSHMGYYTFYPVHLADALGVDGRWLGAISTLGVATEAALMFAFGWLSLRFGVRNLLLVGALFTALRLALIAIAPVAWIAIAANALHGPIILGTLVAPVIFINRLAGDSFRNSIQGVFAVAVMGPARIVGNLLCGWLAEHDTRFAFAAGVACALTSAAIIRLFVVEPREPGAG